MFRVFLLRSDGCLDGSEKQQHRRSVRTRCHQWRLALERNELSFNVCSKNKSKCDNHSLFQAQLQYSVFEFSTRVINMKKKMERLFYSFPSFTACLQLPEHWFGRWVQSGLSQSKSWSWRWFLAHVGWLERKCVPPAWFQSNAPALTYKHTHAATYSQVKRVSHFPSVCYHDHCLCHAHGSHLQTRRVWPTEDTANCPTIN